VSQQYFSDPGDLEEVERASVEELRALQLTRLRWSLGNAYRNCAAYRRKCELSGVRPEDLKSLRDLARFPFTTRQDLRASHPFGMFAVPRERVVRIQESSGTTGRPAVVVGYSAHDVQTWTHLAARSIRAAGGRPGDVVHIALDYGLPAFALGAHQGAELMGCMVVPVSVASLAKHAQVISDYEPDIIVTTPSYLLAIAEELGRQGLEPSVTSLRIALLGGEPWTHDMRRVIEARTGVEAYDIYGLAEVMGLGVACESRDMREGAVVWEDHFYPEIIDPRSEEPVAGEADGELVITTLTREALPLIRYRTRDLTHLLPPTTRPMRRIARIAGRLDDLLVIGGRTVLPSQIEALILKQERLQPLYQLVLSQEGGMDQLAVHVEADAVLASDSVARAHVAAELKQAMQDALGLVATVEIAAPGILPRSEGRATRVLGRQPA
jgi:phenylacetate-CoA ligase